MFIPNSWILFENGTDENATLALFTGIKNYLEVSPRHQHHQSCHQIPLSNLAIYFILEYSWDHIASFQSQQT